MKKQINPTIKAHLMRGAFYLLSLLAVCAIPFALGQSRSRGTAKQSVAKPNAVPSINLQSIDGTVPTGAASNISATGESQIASAPALQGEASTTRSDVPFLKPLTQQ